jgi:DNA modification methylase
MPKKAGNQKAFDFAVQTEPKVQPCKRTTKKANDLDGVRWLTNSISVWSDIRKTLYEQKLKHPAMFPSMLVERLIESFTTRRQKVVFDPFMGSGSTLIAARKMGKKAVGIELNPKYVNLAKDKLEDLFDKSSPKTEYTIHTVDARQMLDYVKPNSVDITITSPPYWDILNQQRTADSKAIRNYGNLESDLGTISDYRAFLDSLQAIFQHVHVVMKPERYCIIVVMDLRKKDKFFPLHSDVAEMMQSAGFIYDDLIIWNRQSEYNNLRPLGYPSVFRINKVHEFCLIFKTKKRVEKALYDKQILSK